MLNQSFTADNFEIIYDIENRKSSITEYLGMEYKVILSQIKSLQNVTSQIMRKRLNERTPDEIQTLVDNKLKREELFAKKKEIQINELAIIAKGVNKKGFKFILNPKDDNIFVIQNTREAFFAIKQLQLNVRKTFNVKQNSRHLILSQIKLLLNDSSPKYVIRTDVSKFFDSIPQEKLLKKINENTLLSAQSRKFLREILDEYNSKKDTTIIDVANGVPRGVGVSSYLSELYMKDIDNQIKNLNDIVYYARYVDDIFIIISPKLPKKSVDNYFARIKEIISREGLTLKESDEIKCSLLDLTVPNITESIVTYLGYALHINRQGNKTSVKFGLSDAKKEKINNRIEKCFMHFNNFNKYGVKNARRDLLLSLRFLCSNTKLSGAKSRVKTGIFYSNYLLDIEYLSEIREIDDFLSTFHLSLYDKLFSSESKRHKYEDHLMELIIKNIAFEKGFTNKVFHVFTKNEFKTIKKILQ